MGKNKNKKKSNKNKEYTKPAQAIKSQKELKKEKVQKIQQQQRQSRKIKAEEEKSGAIKRQKKKLAMQKAWKITGAVTLILVILFFTIGGIGSCFYKRSLQVNKLFNSGLVAVKHNNKWGFINGKNKVKLDFQYDYAFNFTNNKLALVSKDNGFYFINTKGKNVFNIIYESAVSFDDDVAICKKNGVYGAIDSDGKTVIPFDYTNIQNFIGKYAIAEKDGAFGVIDRIGRVVVDFAYEKIESVNDYFYEYKVSDKYGICAIDVTAERYDNILEYKYDEYILLKNGYCIMKLDGLYGLINQKGEIVVETKYVNLGYNLGDYLIYSSSGAYYGYMDFDGNIVLKDTYSDAYDFIGGYGSVQNAQTKKYEVIDRTGKVMHSIECDGLTPYINGRAIYKKGDLYGLIDLKGKVLCEPKFRYISDFYDDGYAVVRDTNNLYGVIKLSTKYKIQPTYKNISLKQF